MIAVFKRGGLTASVQLSREQEQAAAKAETAPQLYFVLTGLQQAKIRNLLHAPAIDSATGRRRTIAEILQDVTAETETG